MEQQDYLEIAGSLPHYAEKAGKCKMRTCVLEGAVKTWDYWTSWSSLAPTSIFLDRIQDSIALWNRDSWVVGRVQLY